MDDLEDLMGVWTVLVKMGHRLVVRDVRMENGVVRPSTNCKVLGYKNLFMKDGQREKA